MSRRRPRKPGRKRDTYDRLNSPIPVGKRDTSIVDGMPTDFWTRLAELNAKTKEDERED